MRRYVYLVSTVLALLLGGAALPVAARQTSDPFLAAQAAALLPAHVSDLERAGNWNRYTLAVALNLGERTARGTLGVEYTNRTGERLDRLYFHLYPNHPDFGGRLDITGATIDGQPVGSGTENGDTLIWLALPRPLAPGARTTAQLSFVARTPRNASANTFGAFNDEAGVWSLANFYPVLARYFPGSGWDRRPIVSRGDFVVSEVALYDVSVDAPSGLTLISSGVPISTTPVAEGVRRERFVSGPQREFYLGATRGLDQASATVDGTRIVVHYQPGNREAGRRSLQIAEQSLRTFNARFGQYPLAELEVVQVALTRFLGMEFPGAVLIEQRLFHNNGRGLETTIAHEIGHQWWYSQVGNDPQGDPWLDEGLASYAQIVYYEGLGAPERAAGELQSFRDMFRNARASGRDAPLGTPPAKLGDGSYLPVVYAKSALFFQALRKQIGEAGFERFLKGYYEAGRYREVVGPDLLRAAESACGCELDPLYRDWVLTAAPVPIP